jgi:hypothetical protein
MQAEKVAGSPPSTVTETPKWEPHRRQYIYGYVGGSVDSLGEQQGRVRQGAVGPIARCLMT